MIGLDLTSISRFKGKEEEFASKILHEDEKISFNKTDSKTRFIAIRWAIKEALFKADNNLYSYPKVNITKQNQKYIVEGYEISTSIEGDLIAAVVLKEK